jgi:hypothetical protein
MRLQNACGVALGVGLALFASASSAAVLFRAGDYSGNYSPGGEWPENGGRYIRYYKDFSVPAGQKWSVEAVGGMSAFQDGIITGLTARWEIRQNIAVGNSGSLVASGNGSIVSPVLVTTTIGNGPIYDYQVLLPDTLELVPGTYWLTVQPYFVSASGVQGTFQAFTAGTNAVGVPAIDGVSYVTNFSPGIPSLDGSFALNNTPIRIEPAVTVYGQIPEPGALGVLGIAAVAAIRRRRR